MSGEDLAEDLREQEFSLLSIVLRNLGCVN